MQTVLTAIGYAIGSYFQYPQLGTIVGAALGGAVANSMLPDQNVQGPRIADLRVIGLEYGDARTYFRGSLPLPGQLDWSTDRRAIATTQTQEAGKGGGPTSSQTTYTYEVDCRFGFGCNVAAGLARLWLNGKLVYNVRPDATDDDVSGSMGSITWRRLTVYTGDPTQLPDPAEEADVGVGNAPAYIGGPSLVFEGLQLGPSGNIPNVVAEWFTKGSGGGSGYHDAFLDTDLSSYSVLSGTKNSFASISGDYGRMIIGSGGPTTTLDSIERTTPPCVDIVGVRFKFNLPGPLQSDDATAIGLFGTGGTNAFSFSPRRETTFDALNRPHLQLQGSDLLLGAAALPVGDYQFDLVINAGSGNSTVEISTLPDQSVVISESLAGSFVPMDFDSQTFGQESGNSTSAGYADLYVLPARADIEDETLEDVVESLLLRAGLQASQFDVSALATITTPVNMAISQVTSTRQVIELLARHYFFTCVESDKLYMRPMGGASVVTIPYEDLGASNDPGGDAEPLSLKPTSELELPGTWVLTYMNLNSDCAKDSQQSDRLGSVSRTVQGVESPLAFTEEQAKAIVDTWRDMAIVAAMGTGTIRLTNEYTALEPGDAFTVTDRDGSTYRLVAPRISEDNGVRIAEVMFDDANVLTQAGITSTDYTPSSTVSVPGNTALRILDIALLRDADDGVGLYAAARGETSSHPGSAVFKSTDNTSWTQQTSITESAVLGSAQTVLGDWTGGNLSDEKNIVTVNVGPGTLSSITHAAMVDGGGNLCLIGDEVLQFRTASLVTAGVYILSGLLRGRKGTEWAMATHAAGDRFVLLQLTGLRRITLESSEISATRYWRGVTFGRDINSAGSQSHVFEAVSLLPWAPVTARLSRVVTDSPDLLLHFNGSNGSTTFTDSSLVNATLTAAGNAQLSTTSPLLGSASLELDGTGDYADTPTGAIYDMGSITSSSNHTFVCRARWDVVNGSVRVLATHAVPASGGNGIGGWQIYETGGKLSIQVSKTSASGNYYAIWQTSAAVVTTATTYHLAFVIVNGVPKIFVDGVEAAGAFLGGAGSASSFIGIDTTRTDYGIRIGATATDSGNPSAGSFFDGKMDEVYWRRNFALYAANFTPPAAEYENPSAISTDIGITFDRRTRLAKNFSNGSTPLGEAAEAYAVDIFSDGTRTTLKRTLTATEPDVLYTTEQQEEDFGSVQSTIYARAHQISTTVGRGYGLDITG